MRVAILGAGVAGLTAGRVLVEAGLDVLVLEKGRGVGGRVATRRREQGAFDHAAQRFSARDPSFDEAVRSWATGGFVAPTEPASHEPWWIPVPTANDLARMLAQDLTVRTSTRVVGARRVRAAWWLKLEGARDAGPFDVVISTAPAPQTAALFAPLDAFRSELARIRYAPTWSVMLACDAAGVTWPETIFTEGAAADPIALLVREGLKPQRAWDESLVRLVLHASSAFSVAHLEDPEEAVAARLVDALRAWPGFSRLRPRIAQAQRWRFARVTAPLEQPALFDAARGLGVASDGMLGPRIEAAWLSGHAVARSVLAR